MVAGGDDHPRVFGEADECVVQQFDGRDGWNGAVVDVAGHEDGVHPFAAHHVHEVVEERGLVLDEVDSVQGAAQVPVGGVE